MRSVLSCPVKKGASDIFYCDARNYANRVARSTTELVAVVEPVSFSAKSELGAVLRGSAVVE